MSAPVRLGTRASALARTQAGAVADALAAALGAPVELVDVTTAGDTSRAPLAEIGGTGVFVAALRRALLEGRVDVAVHSLKDLPTAAEPALHLAVPPREDPRDALVARDGLTLASLPRGARVGTGSPRRAAQLRAARPDLAVVDVRGNVDTRLRAVGDGLDAVVLARAGLARLGRLDAVTEVLDPAVMLPAPGQGALAVEVRAASDGAGAAALRAAVDALDDPAAHAAVAAERALLAALGAGCTAPVGALADVLGDTLHLQAAVVADDGSSSVRMSRTGAPRHAEGLGRDLAAEVLAAGASHLLGPAPAGPRGEPEAP